MSVRAKMKCVRIVGENVSFQCEYDWFNKPEDNSFSTHTPFGTAQYNITNPDAMNQFKEGEYYYFDINPVKTP